MSTPQITLATPADRSRAIETMVAAFVADPALRFFFPDDATYPTYAADFFGLLFDKRVGRGGVFLADSGAAVALWDPPAVGPTTVESTVEFPADVTARLDAYEAAARPLLPKDPHWYLGVLATHPEHTGRRLGRALMAAGVERATPAGRPTYLETTNPRNVTIYQSAGWSVTGETSTMDLSIWVLTGP